MSELKNDVAPIPRRSKRSEVELVLIAISGASLCWAYYHPMDIWYCTFIGLVSMAVVSYVDD